jgi:predicted O-linked N-acetylglucosamine transferase (SPINDLY family)
MMTWNLKIKETIEQNRYDVVSRFYEKLIENEPHEIGNYWYLGLAYLLSGREEDVRTTWLFILSQAEESELEKWTIELVTILEEESRRQENLENPDRSLLIREWIRYIAPGNLDNLCALIVLEDRLERFHPEKLKDWAVIEQLQEHEITIERHYLEKALETVVSYTHKNSIDFVRVSLPHLPISPEYLDKIFVKAKQIAYQRKLPRFSSDLLEILREYYPDDWNIAVNLFWIYISTPNFQKAYDLAKKLYDQSQSLDLQLFSKSLLLSGLMRGSSWDEIPRVCQEYKTLIKRFLERNPDIIHSLVRDSLLSVMNTISYYEDDPLNNRPLLARIGAYFQKNYREGVGFSEGFNLPEKRALSVGKIKIGYIAQTFRRHPVGLLSRWVMKYHDRERFHITVYLVDQPVDEITKQWFSNPEDTIRLLPLDSLAIARQIREDEIDILVDLDSGTTVGVSRIMALKPAPVQVNWLGFDGSGLPAIDYLLADPYVLPEQAQNYYPEKIWRLPNCFVAADGFEVAVPTLRREDLGIETDAVIYLSAQTAIKRNPAHIHLQLRVLQAVPNSYLLIQGVADEEALHALFLSIARDLGINEERIKMIPLYYTELYRANLGIADVILDTYPFNGGTTTLEALWMGIPVVTKVGRQWSSRNGYTLLTNAGIPEGIAWNDEEYIERGVRLGTDAGLREEVRWKLRQSRRTSPLWNTRQFTRDLEDAYRQMWRIYRDS